MDIWTVAQLTAWVMILLVGTAALRVVYRTGNAFAWGLRNPDAEPPQAEARPFWPEATSLEFHLLLCMLAVAALWIVGWGTWASLP